MKQIPNLFTLLNLVCGCLAIIFTLQNGIVIVPGANGTELVDIPEKIWLASLFIGIAALVDFLDGFVARMFRAESEMGKQLDSLADLVSFGVAPAMILYQFLRLSFAQDEGGLDIAMIWLLPAIILPCAAAWRLARYNLTTSPSDSFVGLPVPATGLMVASIPLIYWNVNESWVLRLLLNYWVLYAVILLLSGLMVSRLPMLSLKFKGYGLKKNWEKWTLIILSIVSVLLLKWLAAPVIFVIYLLLSLMTKRKTL